MSDADAATLREEEPVNPEGPSGDAVPELDEETRERRRAALAQVRTFGDPVLRSRASEVTSFGPELEREAERMISIMRDALGVGLAATQLGVMHRLLVFQAGLEATPTAVANPELEWLSPELVMAEEGCLSLPGVTVEVERPLYARVRGLDVHGEPLSIEAAGLEARVLQHEIDHLGGVLVLDRTEREQRKGALRALRQGETYSPAAEDDEPEPAST
ncbi:MAG TPA: peptide deformylase [Solirubrobacterales bacterium]|nr:peptide deformylase [Solirubrobacterales bacterium]